MSALAALRDGVRRVASAPVVVVGVWSMTFLAALPLALVLRDMIASHLGSSLAADTALTGVNYEWMQEFGDQATGVGATFKPTIIGFAAVLDNLSAFLDGTPRPLIIAAAGSAYVGLWLFVAGGILDRYARGRPTRSHGFFAASGVFFFRFLRLAIVQWMAYALVFGGLRSWLLQRVFPNLTRDLTAERSAFFVRAALYGALAIVLAALNLVFDYAKVRAVVEDRRSMIGAVGAAARFVLRQPAAIGLYVVDVCLFLVCVVLYALYTETAPEAGAGFAMWAGVAAGQLYMLARLWVKLLFWASETALFQSRLAHAAYAAGPPFVWPDSPAAEAIRAD